jgi:hypothetical protein
MNSTMTLLPWSELPVPLERGVFLGTLLRHRAGTLQRVVGLEGSAGVHQRRGPGDGRRDQPELKGILGVADLSREQVADVLVDLKRRIQGHS